MQHEDGVVCDLQVRCDQVSAPHVIEQLLAKENLGPLHLWNTYHHKLDEEVDAQENCQNNDGKCEYAKTPEEIRFTDADFL